MRLGIVTIPRGELPADGHSMTDHLMTFAQKVEALDFHGLWLDEKATGAAAGAILGGMLGGKRGAMIGAGVGAAGGTASVISGDTKEALLESGTPLTMRLTSPVTLTIERDPSSR